MSSIETFRAEIRAAQDRLDPVLEGLQDFRRAHRSDEPDEIRQFLDRTIGVATKRSQLLEALSDQLTRLVEDGYPTDLSFEAPAHLAQFFNEQVAAAQAAYNALRPRTEAVTGEVTFGDPVPRS